MQANHERLTSPYDPAQPIEVLFRQTEEARDFAAAGNAGYTDRQLVNAAYITIFNTGRYHDACRDWRARLQVNKLYQHYKKHFTAAYIDMQKVPTTSEGAGYSGNMEALLDTTQETMLALQNASQTDRTTIASLGTTLSQLQQQMRELTMHIQRMQTPTPSQPSYTPARTPSSATYERGRSIRRPTRVQSPYCWTHGFVQS